MYLLDTNVFIQTYKLFLDFDLSPTYWNWLVTCNNNAKLASIKKVKGELMRGNDELAEWAKKRSNRFFLKETTEVTHKYKDLAESVESWETVKGELYTANAKYKFFKGADPMLIAHASVNDYTIVTHEVASKKPSELKIPTICKMLDVACITPMQMLKEEKVKFIVK